MHSIRFIFSIFSCILIILSGCTKQEKSQETQTPARATNVLLEPGTGAVMVAHPTPHRFDRSRWMIQIQLEGDAPTDKLPVIPLADLQAGLVLNVPPGNYKVITSAWIRKYPPASGGSYDYVAVKAGEVVVLRAGGVGVDEHPYPNTKLTIEDRHKWTLQSTNQLQDFISGIIKPPVK